MMSGPHRGDSAHIHYDVWDIGEVHPGVVVIDLVRWELSLLRLPSVASGGVDPEMSFDEIRVLLQNPRKG